MKNARIGLLLALTTLAAQVFADATPGAGGWIHTGDAVRVKKIAMIPIKVYAIGHDMKCQPAAKSKQAIIDADCDKRFSWTMKRDVPNEKIVAALKDSYAMNGYGDAGKIGQALGAFGAELKEGAHVTIRYDAAAKATTFTAEGGSSATIPGAEFMKATWSIWFGKIDPPSVGDELMSKL